MPSGAKTSGSAPHPLDPLQPHEISRAVSILKEGLAKNNVDAEQLRFVRCSIVEPTRQQLASNEPIDRQALLITWSKDVNETRNSRVSLGRGIVLSSLVIPNVQPPLNPYEYELCETLIKAYEPFREAIRKRGHNPDHVCIDAWCPGHFGDRDDPQMRLAWAAIYICENEGDNLYARPVEGIDMRVDLQREVILWFRDDEFVPIPSLDPYMNYPWPSSGYRNELKPLVIEQPEGPSFKVSGNLIEWQGWSFRVGFNTREGMTLHQVGYHDPFQGGTWRSIAHRMSFSEMVVPYGDPKVPHYRKNAFDAGEDGLGTNANTLTRGCDCLGWIKYFDFNLIDFFGNPRLMERVVCLHEEDYGILWKHTNWRTDKPESRRSRRLSISFICTVANYEYGFYVYFYQDATIQFEVKLTGILSTGALTPSQERVYGTMLSNEGLYAPIHQHFFVARLDMAVDGLNNRVIEVDTVADTDGDHNPWKNAFTQRKTLLSTESEAARNCDAAKARAWVIENHHVRNRVGQPVGWKLIPKNPITTYLHPNAPVLRRAGFLRNHLWVTKYHPNEKYPGGDYPNQNPDMDGIPKWVLQNRNIVDTELVVWHVFGVTHMPRLEDWPVMPVEMVGFELKPCNFFAASPAIDVAPSTPQPRVDLPKSRL